jgi:ATP-dependent Lon protease
MARALPIIPIRDAVHFPRLINTLLVVREPSVRGIQEATKSDYRVLVLSQRDMTVEEPGPGDLAEYGIVSEVLQSTVLPDGKLRVVLRGLYRARAKRLVAKKGTYFSEAVEIPEAHQEGVQTEALSRLASELFMSVVEKDNNIPPESIDSVVHAADAGLLGDTITHHLPIKSSQKQEILEEVDPSERLSKVIRFLRIELEVLDAKAKITESVERQLGQAQRDYVLREQLKQIQEQLREGDGALADSEALRSRILGAEMPEEILEKAIGELRRFELASVASPEALVIRNYLDTLCSLPWTTRTPERVDVKLAKRLLDERHFGLEQVKERILDFLAVHQLRQSSVGSILCFVGPPGVGKTSIGRSIADAMGRTFARISLGGVRDEAEIRGHRRTYVGSMPGRIIQALRSCGSRNPVILLDEIDKLGQGTSGDPMSALLEALDPEQNRKFSDHYIEAPFDLGDVIFIATANNLSTLPHALRDRMDVTAFSTYTEEEKFEIAQRFLIPRQKEFCGLEDTRLTISGSALTDLIRLYTREAGVRDLNRQIGGVCRKAARRVAEDSTQTVIIGPEDLSGLLGAPRYLRHEGSRRAQPGLAWGLVISDTGGDVIPIEASLLPRAGAHLEIRLTGSLGDVMKESALAALTYLQSRELTPVSRDIHVHVPEAGVRKEGPSAGLAILLALAGARSETVLKKGFAITGELTLLGRVLPVGGIRDKILAAIRAEFTDVIIPAENEPDLEDLPVSSRDKIRVHLVSTAAEALELVLPNDSRAYREHAV